MAADKLNQDNLELERYGVWVKAGPDVSLPGYSSESDLLDLDDAANDFLMTEEEEQLLGELEESELPVFDDHFQDSSQEPLNLEEEVLAAPHTDTGNRDDSREILLKIANDLKALREEIHQLKDGLTELRTPVALTAAEKASKGFFDDEEDETIALTGDELENILDSADMTEERPSRSSAESGLTEPDLTEPDLTEPDLTEPDLTEPDLTEPDLTEPELTENITSLDFSKIESLEVISETPVKDEDPALDMLEGLTETPEEEDLFEEEPQAIEIDIPAAEDMEEDTVITVDDEPTLDEPAQEEGNLDFEEVTDLDDFGITGEQSIEIPVMDSEEDVDPDKLFAPDLLSDGPAVLDEESPFDEGEPVEIDLSEDTELSSEDNSGEDFSDLEIENISLDDFGLDNSDDFLPDTENADEILADVSVEAIDDNEDEIGDLENLETEEPVMEDLDEVNIIDDLDEESRVFDELPGTEAVDLESLEALATAPESTEPDLEEMTILEDVEEEISPINFPEDEDEIEIEELSLEEEPEVPELSGEELHLEEDAETELIDIPAEDEDETDEAEILEIPAEDAEEEVEMILEAPSSDGETELELELPETSPAAEDDFTDASLEIDKMKASTQSLEFQSLPDELKEEITEVLKYMDQLLESLPDEKIQEFARSEHFEVYKKIFEELGIRD